MVLCDHIFTKRRGLWENATITAVVTKMSTTTIIIMVMHECCSHSHEEHCEEHSDFACDLLEIADEAWMCLLKDKIKEQILATNGKHLDELAKLISESNNSRWKLKMAKKTNVEEFRTKIHTFFSNRVTRENRAQNYLRAICLSSDQQQNA